MCNLGGLFGGKTETQTQQNSQQSGATTNPLAGTILQYGQQNVLPQYSAGNIANTAASLQPNQYITGAAGNQMGATANLFPAFGAAGNLAMNGVSPASVSQWMSPYTQNVINAYNQQADINDGRTLAQAQGSNALTGGLTNSATRGNMDYLRANLAANRNAQAANLYNTGYNTAVGNAFQNAGVQNTAANTLGSLTGAQSGANSALGQLAQLYYGQNQTSAMLPYGLTSQGASTLTGMVPGVGNSYSGTSVGSSTGTTQQNPGLIPSLLGLGGLWGQGADYANKNGGILNALGTFFPKFSEGGSVMPRYKGADHERLAETFHALKGMMRGGSAFPDRFAEGGWVPTVEREPEGPGPMASLFKGMAGAMPTYGGATQQAASDPIATQQAALSKFMEASRPPMARGFADGGSTIEPMSPLSQFSNSMLAASPLAGMARFNAGLQNQRIQEEQNKRQNEMAQAQLAQQQAIALGRINVNGAPVKTLDYIKADEVARHNRATEEQGKWAIDPQRGVAFNTRTMETRVLDDETKRRAEQATRYGMDPNSTEFKQFVLTGKMGNDALSPTVQKQIFELDDVIRSGVSARDALKSALSLNTGTYEGMGAKERAWIMSNLPEGLRPQGAIDTLELNNLVQQQVLDKLKATFGGNPTEGERKILMDVAGSVNLPAENRRRILQRALESIDQREAYNKAQIEALKSKTYFKPTGTPPASPATPPAAPAIPAAAPRVEGAAPTELKLAKPIREMSIEELRGLNIMGMSEAQKREAADRYDLLVGARP